MGFHTLKQFIYIILFFILLGRFDVFEEYYSHISFCIHFICTSGSSFPTANAWKCHLFHNINIFIYNSLLLEIHNHVLEKIVGVFFYFCIFLLLHRACCYDNFYCCTVHVVAIIFIVAPRMVLRLFLLLQRACCYDYFYCCTVHDVTIIFIVASCICYDYFYCCTVHVVTIIFLNPTYAQFLYTLKITNSHSYLK